MTVDSMLKDIVNREGGFSHFPADAGGATKYGITLGTLSFWRKKPTSVEDIKNLTPEEAMAIYKELYYNKPNISSLPDPLDDLIFDFAVNSGPQLAIRALQECLGITADGICGPLTISAVTQANLHDLINKVIRWRVMMFARIVKKDPSQVVFLAGWLSRALSFIV